MAPGNGTHRELACKLIVGLEGSWPTHEEWSWLKQWRPAGVILFSRNIQNFSQLKNLCSSLKRWAPGLEIMADHEGGPVSQLASAVGRPPVAWSLGVLDDVELTRRVHTETGRRLKAAGLDRVLGPCSDVLSEPRNPVIGARAFGASSELVCRHVEAAVRGLTSAGLSCCLKHWPGHGGSAADSHLETTIVKISAGDEDPFRWGLGAGADAVMAGHLLFDETSIPASLSADFLQKTRQKLGAEGVELLLMADDVSMGGLRHPMAQLGVQLNEKSGIGQAMVQVNDLPLAWFQKLVTAGCNQLLVRGIPFAAFSIDFKDEEDNSRLSEPALEDFSGDSTGWDGASDNAYLEARQRGGVDFGQYIGDAVLLDLARTDRWQVAGAQGEDHWRRWDQSLEQKMDSLRRCEHLDQALAEDSLVSCLLVSSHRPMPAHWPSSAWAQSLKSRLAGSGRCLVMGHPSLGEDFEAFLGDDWAFEKLYDVSCEDLMS